MEASVLMLLHKYYLICCQKSKHSYCFSNSNMDVAPILTFSKYKILCYEIILYEIVTFMLLFKTLITRLTEV